MKKHEVSISSRLRQAFVLAALLAGACAQAAVVYVDASATGANDGTSWADAYTSLRTAVDTAPAASQIWVASGTYVPGTTRTDSFVLKEGMKLYGGFTSGMSTLAERDWDANPTVLSGEIQGDAYHTNNSYRIVVANTNGVMDGFVLSGGYADGAAPYADGSAVYASYVGRQTASPNWPQTIANCTFTNNYAAGDGGAIWANYSSLVVSNCLFVSNSSAKNGGVAYFNQVNNSRTTLIYDSIFRQNTSGMGGAIRTTMQQTFRVERCSFIGNSATNGTGGAICADGSWSANPGAVNSLFVGNSATGSAGATGPRCLSSGNLYVMNTAGGSGGGAYEFNTDGVFDNCVFVGNKSNGSGGGVFVNGRKADLKRSLVVGNMAGVNGSGGGAHLQVGWSPTTFVIVNSSTIANNQSRTGGGFHVAVYSGGPVVTNRNIIVWGNTSTVGPAVTGITNAIFYSAIQGGWTGLGHDNIALDPRFAKGPAGTWTAVGAYDPATGKTVLTDSTANWKPGEFAGVCLNPDNSQQLQTYIVTNTATTMTVYGDVGAFTAAGDEYQVWDYHLMSSGGRWTPLGWVYDNNSSPCIDTGDPTSAYSLEPMSNGGRVNMGYYGNTAQASKIFSSRRRHTR